MSPAGWWERSLIALSWRGEFPSWEIHSPPPPPPRPLLAPPAGFPEPWKKASGGYEDSASPPEKLGGSPRGLGRWVTQWVARGLWIQTFPFIPAARTHACPWSADCGLAQELPSSSAWGNA